MTAQAKRCRYKTPHTGTCVLSEITPCLDEKCSRMLLKMNQVATAKVGVRLVRMAPAGWEEGPGRISHCVTLHLVLITKYYSGYQINVDEKIVEYIKYRVFQKDLNIFYSGHRGHRTWHPVIFSYGDTLKTMPINHKLQDRIRAAVQTIDGNMLKRFWQQLDYRIDICRVTKGAHIEHFWAYFLKRGHLHYLCVKLCLILTNNT